VESRAAKPSLRPISRLVWGPQEDHRQSAIRECSRMNSQNTAARKPISRRLASSQSTLIQVKAAITAAGFGLEENFPIVGKPRLCIPELRLAIFLDSMKIRRQSSSSRGRSETAPAVTAGITRTLRKHGWAVLRLQGLSLKSSPDLLSERILSAVKARSKNPKSFG
jgi:hypothetical protein